MGFEYKIEFDYKSSELIDGILRSISEFSEFCQDFQSYEYRSNRNTKGMPDAEARIEKKGLYFCDYGGKGARILKELLLELQHHYGNVMAEEYD
jgi:hypothetical protein